MAEKKFDAQVNYGWGLSLNMTGKAPAVAKRIFNTLADAQAYADDVKDSAIEGLVLSVVADGDKNGVYFVQSIKTEGSTNTAVLVKLGTEAGASGNLSAAIKALNVTDTAVAGQFVSEVSQTDGKISVKRASLADAKVDVDSEGHAISLTAKLAALNQSVVDEKNARENAFNTLKGTLEDGDAKTLKDINDELDAIDSDIDTINNTIGTVAENKTVVQMIADAETSAKAAATKMKLATSEAFLTLESTTDSSGATTYALGTKDLASDAELQDEVTRATAAEASLQAQIGQAATEASGATGLHKVIADAIDALDANVDSTGGSHVTVHVTEANGVISAITVSESDIASANDLTAETTARTAADTALDNRLTKIEGNEQTVGSIKKAVADAKSELLGDAATDYNTLGKLEDKIIKVSGDAKTYSISQVVGDELTSLGANVKEAYKLVENGNAKAGEYIKVYKDSALQSVALVGQELKFTYLLANGQTSTVSVDVSTFLAESEFKDGLQVVDHVVSVKCDAASEGFLTVGADGVKLSGVQAAIDNAINDETQNRTNAINALDATVGTTTVENGKHVAVQVVEENGKLTNVTVTESDIASADELDALKAAVGTGFSSASTVASAITANKIAISAETTARTAEDNAINAKIGEVENGKTVVEMINEAKAAAIAASTVVTEDSEFITIEQSGEVGKTQTYKIKTQDVASATATTKAINDEVTRAKDAESGLTTAINTEAQTRASEDTAIKGRLAVLEGVKVTGENAITVSESDAKKSKKVSLKLGTQPAEGVAGVVLSQNADGLVAKLYWGTF